MLPGFGRDLWKPPEGVHLFQIRDQSAQDLGKALRNCNDISCTAC
jgi:hypothetical protein